MSSESNTTSLSSLFPGLEEVAIFAEQHDVYPLIDPKPHFTSQTYKDQVVIVTGGSTGIGATTALFYAKAGANVILIARRPENLEKSKVTIEKEAPGAQVVVIAGDVVDPEVSKRAVKTAVEKFGRLDIVIANSGIALQSAAKFADKDAVGWWRTQEVNVLGVVNIAHAAIPELLKSKGQIIVTSSGAAHMRLPVMADYEISKHTVDRFVEILALEYPELAIYAIHPGTIATPLADEYMATLGWKDIPASDTLELPAATYLWLTARNAEFLSGRFLSATWDLSEVLAKKDEIVRDNLLVTKLVGPAKSA